MQLIVQSIRQFLRSRMMPVILLWICLTSFNLNKAFHIDDTFHLEAAEWIRHNPASPMSGQINWKDFPSPLYSHNQPPLFFYLIAVFTGFFGAGEIPLHLLLSVFTFLALLIFSKMTDLFPTGHNRTLLLFFAFSPAFIVNQNLMTDVPLLSLVLSSAYFLLKAGAGHKLFNYLVAALSLSAGMLIKYSVLPLVAVLFLVVLLRRDYRYLAVVIIPIGTLFIWSLWNYHEYGSVHFLDRPKDGFHINRFGAFVACIGSMSVFSISLIQSSFNKYLKRILAIFYPAALLTIMLLVASGLIPDQITSYAFNILFFVNGFIVLYITFIVFRTELNHEGYKPFFRSPRIVILLYLCAISAFLILFAPFVATRHILLIIPFILLYCLPLIEKAKPAVNRISIGLTILLGSLLGISDYMYAGYYKTVAHNIPMEAEKTTWTSGHWGWQWYTTKRGMKQYEFNRSMVSEGDYLVHPANVSRQQTGSNLELTLIEKRWDEPDLTTFFAGYRKAGMYSNSVRVAPWIFSRTPIDTIFIYRVDGVNEIKELRKAGKH